MSEKDKPNKPNFRAIVMSTLAAAIGIQSNKNRERDFVHGNIKIYIAAGLIFTTLFIGSIVLLVKLVIKNAGM
ncbi:MAG: DUF2970 domain-containing protein [Pseudomonadales bacterium]|jgi:hypothetical protein